MKPLIFVLIFLLGLRHGIDWDHIAAIADVTGTTEAKRESFILALLYIIGHATVIVILGLLATLIGVNLPIWIDPIMERFVGVTLLLLGLYLFISILRHGKNFHLRSRWMLLFTAAKKITNYLHDRIPHPHEQLEIKHSEKYGLGAAFIVGLIHGVGAETPTQIILFVTAAGVRGSFIGVLLVFTFVAGLMISNSFISIVSILGFAKAKKNSNIYVVLGLVTAVFSLIVGNLFLLGRANFLPAIFGG